ncbi:hypothetical protein ACFVAV_14315 [Nocardia sp. NPDC057663]|uniref:hypothetical protein n=1 Tax=Nocardia sp. NPDC057663 TaxID=3346201 RepID=UPI00366DB714
MEVAVAGPGVGSARWARWCAATACLPVQENGHPVPGGGLWVIQVGDTPLC